MLPPTGNRRASSVEPTLSVCNRDAGDSRYRDGAGEKAARAAARARKKGGAGSWPIKLRRAEEEAERLDAENSRLHSSGPALAPETTCPEDRAARRSL